MTTKDFDPIKLGNIASGRSRARTTRENILQGALGLVVLGALMLIGGLIGAAASSKTQSAVTAYCTAQATETTPKCPPEAGVSVNATWLDGSVGTVTWTGSVWQLDIPGGERKAVAPPHDWVERGE